jgi:hypothetical protein
MLPDCFRQVHNHRISPLAGLTSSPGPERFLDCLPEGFRFIGPDPEALAVLQFDFNRPEP